MLEYIYFVKCPGYEDEHFNFFNEAKEFAMNCLSNKPIITQIEVDRNDFGECTDSADLGTVWSWEDVMQDIPAEPEHTIFSKADTFTHDHTCSCNGSCGSNCTCGHDIDPEFAALDNTLDVSTDDFKKPVPAGMTIEQLVEEMEENEDEVECKWCNELFDKSECRYEVDLGWLCGRCQAAIKSRGETLTFREGPIEEAYSKDPSDIMELEYPSLTVTLYGPKRDVDDWDEFEHTGSHVFLVPKVEVASAIWENCITDEDVQDVPGGLEALEDDQAWEAFLETHFDVLFDKYEKQILDHFEDEATEDFRERAQEEYSMDSWSYDTDSAYDEWHDKKYFGECKEPKPFLEELEEADDYRIRLIDCPECGASQTFDHETGICINCGFNV
jgi:hypothetical protein